MDEKQIQDEVQALAGEIQALEDGTVRPLVRPKAYVVDFSWADPGGYDGQNLQVDNLVEQTKSVAIAAGTLFLVREVVAVYSAVGTVNGTAVAATVVIHPIVYGAPGGGAPVSAQPTFVFDWRIRDTGSDREWTNDWMPGTVLRSGTANGCTFGAGRGVLVSGAELFVSVRAARTIPGNYYPLDPALVVEHRLQFVFRGDEVAA